MKSGDGTRQSKSTANKYSVGKKISKAAIQRSTHPFRKDDKK